MGIAKQDAGNVVRVLREKFPGYSFGVVQTVIHSWSPGDPAIEKVAKFEVSVLVPVLRGKRIREVDFGGESLDAALRNAIKGLSHRKVERAAAKEDMES
jgi:hypothetical protein